MTHESRFTVIAVCIFRHEAILVIDFSGSVGRSVDVSNGLKLPASPDQFEEESTTPTHDSRKSFAVAAHCRSILSSETIAYDLLRSTLSGGTTIQPTIYCAPLCLMARLETTLQPSIYCTLIYMVVLSRLQPNICSAPLCLARLETTLCLTLCYTLL
jgi:hypothetical protein